MSPQPQQPQRTYGGSQPPSDWVVPGWPPANGSHPTSPPQQQYGRHPGSLGSYQPAPQQQQQPQEEIGFRLPENEQPEHPERTDQIEREDEK